MVCLRNRRHPLLVLLASAFVALSTAVAPVIPSEVRRPLLADPALLLAEANHLSWIDNWTEAGPLYERAESLFKRAGNQRSEMYARAGRLFATATSWTGLSRALHRQLRLPVAQTDLKLRLWCLTLSGYADFDLSTALAKRDWTEALSIAESLGDRKWGDRARGELGIIAFLEGNPTRAVSLVGQSIWSLDAIGDNAGEARLLAMLGQGYNEVHRFAEAHWFFTHAISLMKEAPRGGFPFDAQIGEAEALASEGQTAQATASLRWVISEAELEKRFAYAANALVQLGTISFKNQDLSSAKDYLQKAVRLGRQFHFYRALAPALIGLAEVYRSEGDLTKADATAKFGMQISRHLGDRYYMPRDLTAAAEIKLAEHKTQKADLLFEKAENVIESMVLNQHTDIGQAALAGAMSETYLRHFHLVQAQGNVARALQLVEHVRGRVAASRLTDPIDQAIDSPKGAALESEISTLQSALLRTDDPEARSKLQDDLVQTERSLALEENDLTKKHWGLVRPASLSSIQRVLRPDELLLEYVLDEPNAFCIAISREGARIIGLPAGSKDIETLVRSYLQELKRRGSSRSVAVDLNRILLADTERLFQKRRLIVIPDGILHFLPFEALQTANGDFVVRKKVVSYAPSATAIWALRTRRAIPARRTLLALGDVDYTGRQIPSGGTANGSWGLTTVLRDLAELSTSHLQNLPESRREVLSIARIAGSRSKVLLGSEATESAFKSETISDYRIVHLAVHSISDSHYPDRSALVLAAASGKEDGLLQVREIAKMRLRADLVTLSACQTAIGPMEGEAGVISLQMAFLMGGAKAVVASLWNVEDESTTLLMEAFYHHLAQHEDKATALTLAKRELLEKNDHLSPYFWAAFVIVGEAASQVSFGSD